MPTQCGGLGDITHMAALVLLPILSLVLTFHLLDEEHCCWRYRAVNAFVLWGVFVAVSTECLSLFHILTRSWVFAVWLCVVLVLVGLSLCRGLNEHLDESSATENSDSLPTTFRLAIWGSVLVVGFTGLVALIAPPNTWDSMAYHMARVAHWIQNGSVRHYPTCYLPQLYHPPWAEFAITHLQILTGGDRFANGVQWVSMAGSVVGVSLIASLLGADKRAQVFASVLAATIPMGILQGSSTQNDFVVSFWMVCFVIYILRIVLKPPERGPLGAVEWGPVLGTGASLGLAILTKGTAYIYAAPFAVWFALIMLKRSRWKAMLIGVVIGVLVLLLNAGHFLRNTQLFGSPLSTGVEKYTNDLHTPAVLASNIIRNMTLHMGTPFVGINSATERVVRRLHDSLGIPVDDPRTSVWLDNGFHIKRMDTVEDYAGNPLHMVLILLSIAAYAFRKSARRSPHISSYLLALSAAFVLFSGLLKWQPWHSRLHLPLFVLFAPFVAIVTSQWLARHVVRLMTVLLIASLPWVFCNQTRSLVQVFRQHKSILVESRVDQYFQRAAVPYKEGYLGAAAFVREHHLHDIGLMLPYDPFEYQLWVLLKRDGMSVRMEHVDVSNVSSVAVAREGITNFTPTAIIRVQSATERPESEVRASGRVYLRRWSRDLVEVYTTKTPADAEDSCPTSTARLSHVNMSSMVKARNRRPSANRSATKSRLHTAGWVPWVSSISAKHLTTEPGGS